jgi:hypothetical protein
MADDLKECFRCHMKIPGAATICPYCRNLPGWGGVAQAVLGLLGGAVMLYFLWPLIKALAAAAGP